MLCTSRSNFAVEAFEKYLFSAARRLRCASCVRAPARVRADLTYIQHNFKGRRIWIHLQIALHILISVCLVRPPPATCVHLIDEGRIAAAELVWSYSHD